MSELIWINGSIMPLAEARIGVEDRGFQFADGVYEVVRLYNGKAFTLLEHLSRLEKSAAGIHLSLPMPIDSLATAIGQLIDRADVNDGMVYLQLTRGESPRNHIYSDSGHTLLFYIRALPDSPAPGQGPGARLLSTPDERWKRCWIKSIALLPNVLAKNAAVAAGADEAAFVEDGLVSECASSNFFAVLNKKVITAPVGPRVLGGITRQLLLPLAGSLKIEIEQRPPTEREAMTADELFITSTTREISWVSHWNDQPIGDAKCGPVTRALHEKLVALIAQQTAIPRQPQPRSALKAASR